MMKTATLFPDDDFEADARFNNPGNCRPLCRDGRPSAPHPLHNRTATSRTAAKAVRPFVNSQIARVYDFIDSRGDSGATDKETQRGLELSGDSQRPRRVWLRDNGYVRPKPDTLRDGSTVWVTTGKRLNLNPGADSNP